MDGKGIRFYATIGVKGFLVEPEKPLLECYAGKLTKKEEAKSTNCNNDTHDEKTFVGHGSSSSSYLTGELVGTIKKLPEDFIVREILPSHIRIPGLSDDQMNQIRRANLDVASSTALPVQPSVYRGDVATGPNPSNHSSEHGTKKASQTTLKIFPNSSSRPDRGKKQEANSNEQQVPAPPVMSPSEIIHLYLHQGLSSDDHHNHPKNLVDSLDQLHEVAKERIHYLASETKRMSSAALRDDNDNCSKDDCGEAFKSNEVWIPPRKRPTTTINCKDRKKSVEDSGVNKDNQHERIVSKFDFFRAVESTYPLLKTESLPHASSLNNDNNDIKLCIVQTKKSENDNWIRASIDRTFDDLIQYLDNPVDDLLDLINFRNSGLNGYSMLREKIEADKEDVDASGSIKKGKRKRNRDNNRGARNDWGVIQNDRANGLCAALHLKPILSKDDRRKIHRIVASIDKNLDTSAVQINKSADNSGGDSVVLVVSWQNRAVVRFNEKKRKRSSQSMRKNASYPGGTSGSLHTYNNVFCVLKKSQREHLTTMQKLSRTLKCRQSDITFAGIKDMQAITHQFITIRNGMSRHRIERANRQLRLCHGRSIELGHFYNVDFLLNTGDLKGNCFDIVIRNIARVRVHKYGSEALGESFEGCKNIDTDIAVDRIRRHGFINFYGEQRIGSCGERKQIGVRSCDIGRALLKRDYKIAIDLLMTGSTLRESDGVRRVRETWIESGGNPTATLKAFSGDILPREWAVLKGLNRFPDNPLEAIRFVPFAMRTFWVHAYQSLVWNFAASKRIEIYGIKVVLGDLYVENDKLPERCNVQVVTSSVDISSISLDQIVLPLPGFNIRYPENKIATFYKDFLESDGVCFTKENESECTAKGSYRKLIVRPKNLTSSLVVRDDDRDDTGSPSSHDLNLSFELPKGSFATMCLREMMLTTAFRSDESGHE